MSRYFVAVSLFVLHFAAVAQTCPPPQQVTIVPGSGCETHTGARPWVRCNVGTPITMGLRIASTGAPFDLRPCDSAIVWTFSDGTQFTSTSSTMTGTLPNAGMLSVTAEVKSSSDAPSTSTNVVAANGFISFYDYDNNYNAWRYVREGSYLYAYVRTTKSPATFEYEPLDNGAPGPRMFIPGAHTQSIGAGQQIVGFYVPTLDNSSYDPSYTFKLRIQKATGGLLFTDENGNPASYTEVPVSVFENDEPARFAFENLPTTVSENIGTLQLNVRRSGDPTRAWDVPYTTAWGSANPVAGKLSFAVNETLKTISIAVPNDNVWQPDRILHVKISGPYSDLAGPGLPATADIVVQDDDPRPAQFTITTTRTAGWSVGEAALQFTSLPQQPVTATLTSSNPSVASVPSSLAVNTTSARQPFPVTTATPGIATITATLPGGITGSGTIEVFAPGTLTADPSALTVNLGSMTDVALRLTPAPGGPAPLRVTTTNAAVGVPSTVTIDTSGRGTLHVAGVALGTGMIMIAQPSSTGTPETHIVARVQVPPAGLSLTSMSPAAGPATGGTLVTLTGQAFLSTCTVAFGGVASGNVTYVSPVSLTAVAPPHGAGVVDVAITCGSDHDTLASSFTYLALPTRSRAVRH